jgi:hypothetical protein
MELGRRQVVFANERTTRRKTKAQGKERRTFFQQKPKRRGADRRGGYQDHAKGFPFRNYAVGVKKEEGETSTPSTIKPKDMMD